MTASRSVSRPPQLALGEMRPFLLPQQAQIAPLTPPSRTLSIPVCEFLFWTSCGRGRGPPSILQAANEKRGRLSRQKACCCCWLLVVVVVGDEKRDILVGFRDRRRRRSRWLLARYRPLSISPNTARDSSPERQKRLSITSPSPPRPPVRRCHASVPKAWVTGRTRVPGHARAKKTGWPYRQRGGPGKCGAVRTSRPAAEELSATRGTVASVVRRRRSLFAFCALGGLVRGSPARIADDDITSLRARARRSWVFQGFLLFSFMADIDFSTTSDEINITSDGECCAARVIFPPAG